MQPSPGASLRQTDASAKTARAPKPGAAQGAALSSNVVRFVVDSDGDVTTSVAVRQPWLKVEGWALPELPPLITDILLSLDDKFLFFSNCEAGGDHIMEPGCQGGRVWPRACVCRSKPLSQLAWVQRDAMAGCHGGMPSRTLLSAPLLPYACTDSNHLRWRGAQGSGVSGAFSGLAWLSHYRVLLACVSHGMGASEGTSSLHFQTQKQSHS